MQWAHNPQVTKGLCQKEAQASGLMKGQYASMRLRYAETHARVNGTMEVVHRIGVVACWLVLPAKSIVHPAFHVSWLRAGDWLY